mmetsp:Transcript_1880/g.3399  ORF Transcript_1880/g.3399 Transcript_1880/m.3399 type:complete len:267 (-) Transcript_1880:45-845(-)
MLQTSVTTEGSKKLLVIEKKGTEVGEDKIYDTLPNRLVRAEMEKGRVRWSKDNLLDDFIFYLRSNHELVGLLYTHPAHPTDRPTRFILFGFSFCFGLVFEVLLEEIMSDNAETWVIGLILGVFMGAMFWVLEKFFTCECIRKKLDEDEQKRLEEGRGSLEKDQKNVRETMFVCTRICGGAIGCCLFAPGALICYWVAIFVIAAERNIKIMESIEYTTTVWLQGFFSGQVYSLFICGAYFWYEINYKNEQFKSVEAQRSSQVLPKPL